MATMTGGEALVAALAANGVSTVFGIPGTHNLEIYRHLADGPVSHIVCRHEQGAGYAADGFARVARRPGVIVTTSGPGILNASAALASAHADSVPLLAVAPGPPRGQEGADRGWMHEVKDQRAALAAVVDRTARADSPQQVVDAVHAAFDGWASGRPRPFYLEIPVDVLDGFGHVVVERAAPPPPQPAARQQDITDLATRLGHSSSPVLVVGGGAIGVYREVRELAELLGAPVVESLRGKGIMPAGHPLAVGSVLGTDAGRSLVEGADTVLLVGTELSDAELEGRPLTCRGTVCRLDIDAAQLHKNLAADVPVLGSAEDAVPRLLRALGGIGAAASAAAGRERASVAREGASSGLEPTTKPHRWIHDVLSDVLASDDVVVGDSSQVTYLGSVHLWPAGAPDSLIAPASFATLGFAVPAAIGAVAADSGRRVIALLGDGALMFSVQELRTAADLGRTLPILVVDNGGYREIAEEMDALGIPRIAVDLSGPDFTALAAAMGCGYADGSTPETLRAALDDAMQRQGPTLIRILDRTSA